MNPLKLFYDNEVMREAVKEFLVTTLKEMAVERVFDKKAVAGIYESKKAIDAGFDKLAETYRKKEITLEANSR